MTDLPSEIQVWKSYPKLHHTGTWSTERYPAEAVTYVRKEDAEAAQALVLERAVAVGADIAERTRPDGFPEEASNAYHSGAMDVVDAIRALATASGVEALAALRAERDALRAETDAFRMCVACGIVVAASHDRTQPGPGCKAPDACTFDLTPSEAWQHWRTKEHAARAERDDALARLAAAEGRVAALTEALKGIAGYNDMPGVEWRERHPGIAEKFDISRRAKLGAGHALATYARERLAALAAVTPPADTGEGRT